MVVYADYYADYHIDALPTLMWSTDYELVVKFNFTLFLDILLIESIQRNFTRSFCLVITCLTKIDYLNVIYIH